MEQTKSSNSKSGEPLKFVEVIKRHSPNAFSVGDILRWYDGTEATIVECSKYNVAWTGQLLKNTLQNYPYTLLVRDCRLIISP